MNDKEHPIEVIVCEFHQEVLEYIHQSIIKKKLPFSGIKMIHFDSHPDLAFPTHLFADDSFCKEKMYNDLDIADWILPLMYAGHVNSLIWVKPPWAEQIPDTTTSFAVGKEIDTGKMRVTSTEDYFLEDCSFTARTNLCNIKDVLFEACQLKTLTEKTEVFYQTKSMILPLKKDLHGIITESWDKQSSENKTVEPSKDGKKNYQNKMNCSQNENILRNNNRSSVCNSTEESLNDSEEGLKRKHVVDSSIICTCGMKKKKSSHTTSKPCAIHNKESTICARGMDCLPSSQEQYILDIDLDFFSVTNPFLQDYTEDEYKKLKKIYSIRFPEDRKNQAHLQNSVTEARRKLEALEAAVKAFGETSSTVEVQADENEELMEVLREIKERKNGQVDWDLVHSAGVTTDLPHHISTEEEIDELVEEMVLLLKNMPPPAVITLARSTVDEYCPPDQIEMIQEKVVAALQLVYKDLKINCDYKDDSRLFEQ